MSSDDLEAYEARLELDLYREYKDVVDIFTYAVETERRFYLCNAVDVKVRTGAAMSTTRCRWGMPGCGICTVRPGSSNPPRC